RRGRDRGENSKHQAPKPQETPNSQPHEPRSAPGQTTAERPIRWFFGIWKLTFFGSVLFGAWNFIARLLWGRNLVILVCLADLQTGCATSPPSRSAARPFVFNHDTFAYANELVWVYGFDDHG